MRLRGIVDFRSTVIGVGLRDGRRKRVGQFLVHINGLAILITSRYGVC